VAAGLPVPSAGLPHRLAYPAGPPVIDGSDTNFSQPFVLDYPHNGFPTDSPRPQLLVNNLTGFSSGTILNQTGIIDTQEWGADFGVLP
jgi:hypothetical protein